MKDAKYHTRRGRRLASGAFALLASLSIASAQSSFVLVNDFEHGAGDFTWVQDGWGVGSAEVVTDPLPVSNMLNSVLAIQGGTVNTSNLRGYLSIPAIADGTSATVFVRFAIDSSESPLNGTISLSPLEAPDTWNHNNVLMIFGSGGDISYRNGGSATDVVADGERVDLTWYKAWFQVDNEANTSSLYLQGGPFAEPTLMAEDYAFREDAPVQDVDDIIRLFLMVNSGPQDGANTNGVLYVDDIYVDTENLTTDDPTEAYPRPSFNMLPAGGSITLDGTRDAAYLSGLVGVGAFTGVIDGPEDLSVQFTAAYDDAGIYLFFDITDDVFSSNSPDRRWHDDSIEIFFDPNNNRKGGFDKQDDVKLFLYPQEGGTVSINLETGFPAPPAGVDMTGLDAAMSFTETGWTAEVFVPWAGLQIEPFGDWTMGFAFAVNDDDNNPPEDEGEETDDDAVVETDREGIIFFGANGAFNLDTSLFGYLNILTPKEINVGRVSSSTAIAIDGVQDALYASSSSRFIANRWLNNAPAGDHTELAWYVTFDNDNLYLFVEITDESLSSDSGDSSSWHDDALEIYIDGNNNKGGNADGVNDFKWTVRLRDDDTLQIIDASGQFPPNPAGADFSTVEWAHAVTETGWNLEGKIPLSLVQIDTTAGSAFGIDFLYNDDDDGGERDGIVGWSGAASLNNRTDLYGTAYIWQPNQTQISKTDEEITIDAQIDDAYASSGWNDIKRRDVGRAETPASDISASWSAVMDDTFLYLIVDVIDDVIVVDSGTSTHNDDSLEIYFDPSNNGTGNFDNVEDIKFVLQPQFDENNAPIEPVFSIAGFPSPPAGSQLGDAQAAWTLTELGWRSEMRIPLELLKLSGKESGVFGFDIVVNDDDDGEGRDTLILWSTLHVPNFGTHEYGDVAFGEMTTPAFAALLGAEWIATNSYNSWMGQFWLNPDDGGWIHHEGLQWLYTGFATEAEGFWLYSATLEGYIYIYQSSWQNFYIDAVGWAYYAYVGEGVAYYYDYAIEDWVLIN